MRSLDRGLHDATRAPGDPFEERGAGSAQAHEVVAAVVGGAEHEVAGTCVPIQEPGCALEVDGGERGRVAVHHDDRGRASLEAVGAHVGEALAEPLPDLGEEREAPGHHGLESGAGGIWSIRHHRCHRAHAGHLVKLVPQERSVEFRSRFCAQGHGQARLHTPWPWLLGHNDERHPVEHTRN